MPASPHYFGPSARSHFGFVHWPPGPIRGAAVLCPPLAYEQVCAYRTLRLLAEQLAANGFVTLRIDYDGTGNSMGSAHDPRRVAAWSSTIADAVAELRSFGLATVTLVGLRLGATLAATVAETCDGIGGLVLWDPVDSGRRYSRALRLMSSSTAGEATAQAAGEARGGISVAGICLTEETLADLGDLRLGAGSITVDTLVVERAEAAPNVAPTRAAYPPAVDVVRLNGTNALLDGDAERAVVPAAIVEVIVKWVGDRARDPLDPQPMRPQLCTVTGEQTDAGPVRHEALRIGRHALFAVQTSAPQSQPTRAVVMVNNGVATHVGPGRAWVQFAAACADNGWLALRMDFSGLGDSPSRPGRPDNDAYPPTAAADLLDAVDQLRSTDVERVAVVGLCSGALLGYDGALGAREIDVLFGINGRFDKPFTDSRHDRQSRAARQTSRLFAIPLGKAPLFRLFDAVPTWIWRCLDRLHLVAAPTHVLDRVLARGAIRIVMLFGPDEWGLKALRRRGGKRFLRVVHDPAVRVIEVPGLDHSMFDSAARREVEAHLLELLQAAEQPVSRVL
jgi:alpha-beta hydrolase superfamily lysophospholipase